MDVLIERHPNVFKILKSTLKGLRLSDEHGRTMRFPTRQDYVRQLKKYGLIVDETEFVDDDSLTEAVYLDWLRRPQVGCVFAQLLARPVYRAGIKTVVARGAGGSRAPNDIVTEIVGHANESANDPSIEALTVLLPEILDVELLSRLVWELGRRPGWSIEREHPWRRTLVLVGLRVEIVPGVVAETLGMGPFDIFPTTRQCPVTTLEIRTKPKRAKVSHRSQTHLAAHLADIPVEHVMNAAEFRSRFLKFTPWLKKRILGQQEDMRAKASVTYSLPAAIWSSLKTNAS